MKEIEIYNQDCVNWSQHWFEDKSVDLIICDPPFGINESSFDKHYNRNESNVLEGYVEAPEEYLNFSKSWMEQAYRILKDDGSCYIISGWTNLKDILISAEDIGFELINLICWKFNFGVATQKKYVTSHYPILYLKKKNNLKVTFNTYCRFGFDEKLDNGNSALYNDMQDVWIINKEFKPNETKNKNKLPDELIRKMILYSSNENDVVCDFFMGNFTTAFVGRKLGRKVCGFELNSNSYEEFYPKLENVKYGEDLINIKINNTGPINRGKKLEDNEKKQIKKEFLELNKTNTKKESISILSNKFGRGRFSIERLIK